MASSHSWVRHRCVGCSTWQGCQDSLRLCLKTDLILLTSCSSFPQVMHLTNVHVFPDQFAMQATVLHVLCQAVLNTTGDLNILHAQWRFGACQDQILFTLKLPRMCFEVILLRFDRGRGTPDENELAFLRVAFALSRAPFANLIDPAQSSLSVFSISDCLLSAGMSCTFILHVMSTIIVSNPG